ncbi:hypothetical protein MW887_000847 [Aspergillus wentii]|nr:hypothetical protein MW887_000847 [Aspergillus wentii]
MWKDLTRYTRLANQDHNRDDDASSSTTSEPKTGFESYSAHQEAGLNPMRKRAPTEYYIIIVVQAVVIGLALVVISFLLPRSGNQVYTPAHSAIRYHNVVYDSGFRDEITKYQGKPSPEIDQAWNDLYPMTYSRITGHEAQKLINQTIPIPNDPDGYLISLDIFHQLHCLNMIRKKVWGVEPATEIEKGSMEMDHLDHCIDSVRQSLMCSADVTALPWAERDGKVHPVASTIHTCRDFGAIMDWAAHHKVENLTQFL